MQERGIDFASNVTVQQASLLISDYQASNESDYEEHPGDQGDAGDK